MTSIRRQLLLSLLGALTVAGLGTAVGVYIQAWHEVNALFDYQLKQIALSLRDHAATAVAVAASTEDAEHEVVIQIWDEAGLHLYHSHPGHPPPQTGVGWTTTTTPHGTWHVFSLHDDDRIIQVAQPLEVRRAMATAMVIRTLLPWLVVLPMLGGVIWWLVSRGLRPLTAVAQAVNTRTPQALEPLPVTAVPQEVQPLVTALNTLLQRLAIALAAQQAFLADAAHALRTPLTAVSLQTQVVARAREDTERQQALATLQQGVQRVTHLVQQLLTLAREAPDAAQRPFGLVDLPLLLSTVIADQAPIAAEKMIDLGLTRADPASIAGDTDSVRLLLENLLDNALRYTAVGGVVDVSIMNKPCAVCVEIADTGPGIPPEDLVRVFDRFYRRAAPGIPGSGLGLAIVKTIAERHHATVSLSARASGVGLVVRVTFPQA
jgi:two-component system OmpR family sensor kinase